MEQKEIKIVPPDGYEFDTENSTFDCIKFKKKDVHVNMFDVYKHLTTNLIDPTDNTGHYLHSGNMCLTARFSLRANIKKCAKVAAYAALSDIAEYYNKGWKPDFSNPNEKYYIFFDHEEQCYKTEESKDWNCGEIFFKSAADARSVIENPNFREILDVLYKK